jgi:hypothetical protein
MKFRRENYFQFTGLDTFVMKVANGFELSDRAINNTLHTSLHSQPEVNVAATRFKRSITAAVRNEAKGKQVTDSEEENSPDSDSEPELQIAGVQRTTMRPQLYL